MSAPAVSRRRVGSGLARRAGASLLALLLLSTAGHADPAPGTESGDAPTLDMLRRARAPTIHIDSASLGSGPRRCDATEAIRQQCEARGRCEVEIDRSLCPTKPLTGLVQTLSINYRCRSGEANRIITAEAPNPLRLVCAPY